MSADISSPVDQNHTQHSLENIFADQIIAAFLCLFMSLTENFLSVLSLAFLID